jgi:RimJ/RimL family protein N-acetyltransferase
MPPTVRTHRLELIASDAELAWAAVREPKLLAELIDATVPAEWPPKGMAADQEVFAKRLDADPEMPGWLHWFIVRVGRGRMLVGGCGFSGPPDDVGDVTIGYAMLPAFQKKGYATEAVGALIDWAFEDPRTRGIVGRASVGDVPSVRVLEKNGLSRVDDGADTDRLIYALRRKPA